MDTSKSFKIDEELVCRKNQDGTIVLMKMDESDNFYKVNGVATEVWELLQNNVAVDEIYNLLTDKYDVTREKIVEDTENFIADLLKFGMVTFN